MAPYVQMWRDILSEILSLRDGRPTALRTRDLYNPEVAGYREAGTVEACVGGLATMNSIVRDVTRRTGGTFVPVNRAFNGPDGLWDLLERGMLVDGAHLNEKGVALMARVHHEAGYAELTGERSGQ